MQLSKFTDYAFRSLIYLAKNTDENATVDKLAENLDISIHHLKKVINKLAKTEYIVSIKGVRIYLLMMPIVGINIVATSYFQSIGKAKLSMFVSLLRQVILLIPFTLILPLFIGLDGVWAAGAFADFFSVVITIILIKKEFKSLNKLQEYEIAS